VSFSIQVYLSDSLAKNYLIHQQHSEVMTMSLFKRISATLVSRVDQVVSEMENHEAVIQATLNDMRKKVAEAKVRLGQVRREEERLRRQMAEQREHARRWRRRAVDSAKDDEAMALECVGRSHQCQTQVERLEQAAAQYAQTAQRLAGDIVASEQRLAEIKQKLTLMRARQSASSAMSATSEPDGNMSQLLDDTFDRWEINISQAEMTVESFPDVDPMEREFVTREKEEELRRELNELLAQEDPKDVEGGKTEEGGNTEEGEK
jgi:phage shock protein A